MGLALSHAGAAYQDALDYLFRRTTGPVRLGLERTRALLAHLGDPHLGLRTVHVAGTNGKGSTVATLEALLRERGLRVGKYTSPHLVHFGERIVVNGVAIPPEAVTAFVAEHADAVERIGATFFEATTALALLHFVRERADVAVVEAGLGGRLDSTNVVTPLAAVVTTIGIDHTEYLGSTTTEIAREKAGIFKPGVPAVVGDGDAAVATQLAAHARAVGASPVRVLLDEGWPTDIALEGGGTWFTVPGPNGSTRFRTPLVGRHQAANAALALLTLDVLGPEFALDLAGRQAALDRVGVVGRFDRRGRFLFDVAHNPDGAAVVARTLAAVAPARPVVALLAVLSDKDWRGMMAALAPLVDRFVLTVAPTAPASRLWDPEEAAAFAAANGWIAEVERDFDAARARAEAGAGTVLVTGSFHTVGDLLARLPAQSDAG